MVSLHELTVPIDQATLQALQENPQKPLESLQGHILSGHGRGLSVHMFLIFKEGKETEVKEWIKRLAPRLTSAQKQLFEAQQRPDSTMRGSLFMSFFLAARGYEYLYPDDKDKSRFDDEAFLRGMKAAQHRLNDPPDESLGARISA